MGRKDCRNYCGNFLSFFIAVVECGVQGANEMIEREKLDAWWDEVAIPLINKTYCDWKSEGSHLVLKSTDYFGDNSGDLVSEDIPDDLHYDSLRDWAQSEYTGNSEATYISGCGLRYIKYSEEIDSALMNSLWNLAEEEGIDTDSNEWSDFWPQEIDEWDYHECPELV